MCTPVPGFLRPNTPDYSVGASAATSAPSKTSGDVQSEAEAARINARLSRRGFLSNLRTSGFGDTSQVDVKGVTLGV